MATFTPLVRACLWSYDIDTLDLERDKRTIIFQILNYGGSEACAWLFKTYAASDISAVVSDSARSEWSRKSLNFWNIVLGAQPSRLARFA